MVQLPSVSVVMCTYNGSAFIDEQIKSIVEQDAKLAELIIVDDCSTDATWAKLQTWQQQYQFIQIHQNRVNLGYNKNFENAIQMAKSELIALADQDDIWMPQKLSSLLPLFADPTVMLAHSRSVRLKNGQLQYKKAKLHHHFSGTDVRRFFFFNPVTGHDAVFRRSLVQHILPIPPRMMYDWWIAVQAVIRGRIASVPLFLVQHRIHTGNSYFTSDTDIKKKEPDLPEVLSIFATIPALNPSDRHYLETLIELLRRKAQMPSGTFSAPLFRFLYRHRYIIFGHKKRLFPELNYLKNTLKFARKDYKGKGLSF